MKNILITGFEPFDNDAVNPSALLLESLSKKNSKHTLHFQCLPVTFKESFNLLADKIEEFKPDVLIMTGFAKSRNKISIEKIAINWIDARIPDNNGITISNQLILENSIAGIFSTFPIEEIYKNLGEEFEVSYSAGTFVCNYLYYQSLSHFKIPQVFIHLPGNSSLNNEEIFNSIFKLLELI